MKTRRIILIFCAKHLEAICQALFSGTNITNTLYRRSKDNFFIKQNVYNMNLYLITATRSWLTIQLTFLLNNDPLFKGFLRSEDVQTGGFIWRVVMSGAHVTVEGQSLSNQMGIQMFIIHYIWYAGNQLLHGYCVQTCEISIIDYWSANIIWPNPASR